MTSTAAMSPTVGTAVEGQSAELTTSAPPPDPTAGLWSRRGGGRASSSPATAARVGVRGRVLDPTSFYILQERATIEQERQPTATATFDVQQKWEGVVTEVNGATFVARLLDLSGSRPDQEAEIYIDEVSPRDRKRLAAGAIFYWYIGYRDEANGDRERASRIRFRRLPPLTTAEVEAARQRAAAMRARLGWR
jgi:hypothetical protein